MLSVARFGAALACAAGCALTPVSAQSPSPAPSAQPSSDPHAIIERIVERNPSLNTFEARVHVNVRMLSFPFLAPKLDGTAYYKRPDSYEIVFDRVPSYAHGITKLFGDIGDPAAWEKDSNVVFDGIETKDGRPYLELSMTKKIRSDQLREALAFVDPATYQVARMEWHYYNGGSIVMTESYKTTGTYQLIAAQHADIHIPYVRAVADASYGTYQTNIDLDDGVFTKK